MVVRSAFLKEAISECFIQLAEGLDMGNEQDYHLMLDTGTNQELLDAHINAYTQRHLSEQEASELCQSRMESGRNAAERAIKGFDYGYSLSPFEEKMLDVFSYKRPAEYLSEGRLFLFGYERGSGHDYDQVTRELLQQTSHTATQLKI